MNAQDPAVSVVLPTYNRAALLPESIRSVLGQTYRDLEIIIVDDGSTDDTASAVAQFADRRIRYCRLPENRGLGAARNAGIREARAPFIAFQDDDDLWEPEKLDMQMPLFASAPEDVGVVYTAYVREDGDARDILPPAHVQPKEGDVREALRRGSFITMQTVVMRRRCFDVAGMGDERLTALEDWEHLLRVSRHFRFLYIARPLVRYRVQTQSITRSLQRFRESYEMVLVKHRDDLAAEPRLHAWHLAIIGSRLCREGEMRKGRRYLLRAVRRCPSDARYWAAALAALLGRRAYLRAVRADRRRRGLE